MVGAQLRAKRGFVFLPLAVAKSESQWPAQRLFIIARRREKENEHATC